MEIYGYDFGKARTLIQQVQEIMHKTDGLADIEVSREENYPEVNVVVDSARKPRSASATDCRQRRALLTERKLLIPTRSFYTDPQNGNEYYISAWPRNIAKTLSDLENILLTARRSGTGVAPERGSLEIECRSGEDRTGASNAWNRDLGSIAADLERSFAGLQMADVSASGLEEISATAGDLFRTHLRQYARVAIFSGLYGDGRPVQVVDRSIYHHVFGSDGHSRRHPTPLTNTPPPR